MCVRLCLCNSVLSWILTCDHYGWDLSRTNLKQLNKERVGMYVEYVRSVSMEFILPCGERYICQLAGLVASLGGEI